MNAIRFEMTVDDAVASAVPKLRPMLGRRVEVIALDTAPDTPPRSPKTLDDFLVQRLTRPETVAPVHLEDMDRAILEGALGGDV